MSEVSRRCFIGECLGGCAALTSILAGCKEGAVDERLATKKSRGVSKGSTISAPGNKKIDKKILESLQPEDLLGERLWEGAKFNEAQARLRVAEVLKSREMASWAVYDVLKGARIHHGAGVEWNKPDRFPLGWLGSIPCAYTAMRTGHLEVDEVLLCRGDPGVPQGHGKLNVVEALRVGCPSFFLQVAGRLTYEEFRIGARLLRLEDQLPERPEGFLERLRLFAAGEGLEVTFDELSRTGIRLARGDTGDAAMLAVRLGLLKNVRRGRAQKAGVAGMGIAGMIGPPKSEAGESVSLFWSPFQKARFLFLARSTGETDPALLAGRVFKILHP